MLALNLPQFPVKVTQREGKKLIFDTVRRKYVALTPEEWVRQHFVNYLITAKGYPAQWIANEVSIQLNQTQKRCDTVVYDRYLTPLAVVEYKSPMVEITESVFDQIVRYNMVLTVPYLIVSNGLAHYCCHIDYKTQTYRFLEEIPQYTTLSPLTP